MREKNYSVNMIRSLQNANWLDTMTYHQAMKDPVKKEYVQHRKSKNYLNEPPGYPVYRTFKIGTKEH